MWDRLTPEATQVIRLAHAEAQDADHQVGRAPWTYSYIGDEHVLLGILRHGDNAAARLLQAHGLDLDGARERLREIGPTLRPHIDADQALRAFGIDSDQLRQRMEVTFGEATVQAAERRVRRRPWWRGGRTHWARPCTILLAKRAYDFAARLADRQGEARVSSEHLLYGLLYDILDPVGTQMSRRSHRQLAEYGWRAGQPHPLRLLLASRDLDPTQLRVQLCTDQVWPP